MPYALPCPPFNHAFPCALMLPLVSFYFISFPSFLPSFLRSFLRSFLPSSLLPRVTLTPFRGFRRSFHFVFHFISFHFIPFLGSPLLHFGGSVLSFHSVSFPFLFLSFLSFHSLLPSFLPSFLLILPSFLPSSSLPSFPPRADAEGPPPCPGVGPHAALLLHSPLMYLEQ